MTRALVVGSVNVDLVVRVRTLPSAGATVLGDDAVRHAGGKGGNQAAALSRLGARTSLLAAVGADPEGDWSLVELSAAGVDTSPVVRVPEAPTGLAVVAVDDAGENLIVVSRGANAHCPAPVSVDADVVVVQLEVPSDTVLRTLQAARAAGARSVLNAAPPRAVDPHAWALVDLLVVNEDEAAVHGEPAGVGATIVTLGGRGASVHVGRDRAVVVPAPAVEVVDTTGAGDCFTAAAALALAEGADPVEAARFAVVAAALSVGAVGARAGYPTRDQVANASERIQASS